MESTFEELYPPSLVLLVIKENSKVIGCNVQGRKLLEKLELENEASFVLLGLFTWLMVPIILAHVLQKFKYGRPSWVANVPHDLFLGLNTLFIYHSHQCTFEDVGD